MTKSSIIELQPTVLRTSTSIRHTSSLQELFELTQKRHVRHQILLNSEEIALELLKAQLQVYSCHSFGKNHLLSASWSAN